MGVGDGGADADHRVRDPGGGGGGPDRGLGRAIHVGDPARTRAGQVGDQGHDGSGDGTGALQDAPGQHTQHAVGLPRHQPAEGEQDQATYDHRLAPNAIGQHAEGYLQKGLGQAVGTDGHADQQRGGACEVLTVGGQHRQHHEQPEHAEGEHAGQRGGGAALLG